MRHRRWFTLGVSLLVMAIVGTACAGDDDSPGGTGTDTGVSDIDCATVEFGCVEVASGAPINIGTLLVISGADAALGQDSQNGAVLAADYWDGTFDGTNGEILGHPIDFTHEDDLCSAEGGQAGATALAADETVVGVIGTSCSSAAQGVADTILGDEGILLFSPSNTSPALTAEGIHQPFYARTAHNDRIQGAIVSGFVYDELGATTAATIADESPYTQGLVAAFEANFEAAGGTITGSEQINSEDTNFESVLTSLNDGDPEVLYFPVFVNACTQIMSQEADLAPDITRVTSDGCWSDDTFGLAGDAITGSYASGPDVTAFQTNPFFTDEFLPAYEELFPPGPTSAFNAHAFDATTILLQAIEAVAIDNGDGTLSIPRQALRDEVFATEGYEGIIGPITCTELGDCASEVTIGVFEGPNWPIAGGNPDSEAVYSDTKSLNEVL
jgi:branched-chain amino acid transport system substrate-binding protein